MFRRSDNPTAERPYLNDPNYYRLGYQLAAQLMNAEHWPRRKKRKRVPKDVDILYGEFSWKKDLPSRRSRARLHAERIDREAKEMLAWYERRRTARFWTFPKRLEPPEKRLCLFLTRTVRPCLQLVIAASLRRDGESLKAEELVRPLRGKGEEGKLSYRALYNFACFEASAEKKESFTQALLYLQQALREAPGSRGAELADWAQKDPSLRKLHGLFEFEMMLERFQPDDGQ